MTDTQQASTSGTAVERKMRRLRVALIWSLAVNLLVLGSIGGAIVKYRQSGGEQVTVSDGPNPFLRALTRKDARKLRSVMHSGLGPLAQRRAQSQANLRALLVALRAETFSAETLTAKFHAISAANQARVEIGQDAILDHLLTLDALGRAAFADRLEEAIQRRPGAGFRAGHPPRRDD